MRGIKLNVTTDKLGSCDTKNGAITFAYRSPIDRFGYSLAETGELSIGNFIGSIPWISFPRI